jgi:hypothetical protein
MKTLPPPKKKEDILVVNGKSLINADRCIKIAG